MRIPTATYRCQFNRHFRIQDARALIPYLDKLGISDLYASPIFKARRGSVHGYDVTDPSQFNPELGTAEEFNALAEDLRARGMGLLLDIVPNHMAANCENPWWMDVLENGSGSPYASYFDVRWGLESQSAEEKIFLPILGSSYGTALENQELQLQLEDGDIFLHYYAHKLPLDPGSYYPLVTEGVLDLLGSLGEQHPAARETILLIELIERLPNRNVSEWDDVESRRRDVLSIKTKLRGLCLTYPEFREFLSQNLRVWNGIKGNPSSFDPLDQLLDAQAYQLGYWQAAREKINYRRFFDVSELIGLRTKNPQVFEATHQLVIQLVKEGKVSGLRIDHIDGLYTPGEYLERLQKRIAEAVPESAPFYVVVEKILAPEEPLPPEWPLMGTTGYDFLGALNGIFVDPQGLEVCSGFYTRFTGIQEAAIDVVYAQKKHVCALLFSGEMLALGLHLGLLAERDRHARDLSPLELQHALVEVTACLPVYRTYIQNFEVPPRDRPFIEQAIADARLRNPQISAPVYDFLRRVLLLDLRRQTCDQDKTAHLQFVLRWQQLSSPIMAKGMEDTAMYLYNPLVSMNEVGGQPVPTSIEEFHRFNRQRRDSWPLSLNATSTHDTKRSEDVRARINLLSETADEWTRKAERWRRWNQEKKQVVGGRRVPDSNEELLLYQTLLGSWPLNPDEMAAYCDRIKAYTIKAAREAKVDSSWLNPNYEYEQAALHFVDSILEPSEQNQFLAQFQRFQKRIAFYGAINSLAQVLLKITSPGIPDLYQGTELWDFSLVDPDNRRPVDYVQREYILSSQGWPVSGPVSSSKIEHLLANWWDGGVKAYLISRALNFRREYARLFQDGEYLPLWAQGPREDHAIAFARRFEAQMAVIVVPRFLTKLSTLEKQPLGRRIWKNTRIALPAGVPLRWRNVLTGEQLHLPRKSEPAALHLADILLSFPVGLLFGEGP